MTPWVAVIASRGEFTGGVGKLGGNFSFTAVLLISTVPLCNGKLHFGLRFSSLIHVEGE